MTQAALALRPTSNQIDETPASLPAQASTSAQRRRRSRGLLWSALAAGLVLPPVARGQTMKAPDITKTPTLYVVPYAHLDTQWRWEFPQTISQFLLKTMRVNFDYMDKYPHYVFNWSGANRYRLMKEYYPADYARMKGYVAAGRWYPAGSSVEEGDVNLPSAEGIFRQVLYGNAYFRNEFGKASSEYMLPDCFGFPASLPSILAHAGVKGFSTQKLSADWQPAPKIGGPGSPEDTPEGIPFNVGIWTGPDGKSVLSALNPGGYGSNVYTDLSQPPGPPVTLKLTAEERARLSPQQIRNIERPRTLEQDWVKRIHLDGEVTGVFADYHYVGTGDVGGATEESTVKLLEAIVTQGETTLPSPRHAILGRRDTEPAVQGTPIKVGGGPVHVVESVADQMFKDITPAMTSRMPRYAGDLELINHSAGSLTSQAYHKRWVTRNENLADAAEKASLAADWMGGRSYPRQRLNDTWMLALGGHFHDTAAGTATPLAYQYAWNDDVIVANQFSDILTDATQAVASGLDTRVRDTRANAIPVIVYNSLNIAREDLVEAAVPFPQGAAPVSVVVRNPAGEEVPAQISDGKVLFLAALPSVGYAVYEVAPATGPARTSALKVTESSLENARYRVELNPAGDVSSIFDKTLSKELLSAPIRLAISTDTPKQWPAWNMDFDQEQAAPRAFVSGPARIRVKESGPVRVAVEVTRETEGSKFVQTVSLSAGDPGNRVEFSNAIDWKVLAGNLKATFPLAAANQDATYNWEVGTIQRPNAQERQFEVASHRWIDLTDKSGSFGATLLTDCKNGSDKPTDNTLRLTLLRSPGLQPATNGRQPAYSDQANQDWGHHDFVFGLAGHPGGWREAQTDWQAYRLNNPPIAFATSQHPGSLGRTFSLLRINNPRIRVLALKRAEASDEIVLRMVELDGKPAPDVRVSFAGRLSSAREIDAQEQPLGPAKLTGGTLSTSFTAYQPRTFAVRLDKAREKLAPVRSLSVPVPYDLAVASNDDTPTGGGGFDGKGGAIPAELLPQQIDFNGVQFTLAAAKSGTPNALVARGQTIDLPRGPYNRVYLLAASAGGDQTAPFRVGSSTPVDLTIQDWSGFIGQWDTRIWKPQPQHDWTFSAGHAVYPAPDDHEREQYTAPRFPDDFVRLEPGYTKPAELAWYASHHHTAAGLNQPYAYSYLFAYPIDLPADAHSLTLPNNDKIRILAISVAQGEPTLKPAQPLYDTLEREPHSPLAASAVR